jgi:hypothetical protein
MKKTEAYEQDLAQIRSLMERSAKFISLSGISGVLSGTYALLGAFYAYYLIYYPQPPVGYVYHFTDISEVLPWLIADAIIVLVLSLGTGFWLSLRKARANHTGIWNTASRKLFANLGLPLITGGFFILILLFHGEYELVASGCLIFYGLALLNGSFYTFEEIRYLGMMEIAVGLFSAAFPGYSLVAWTLGFGVLHIVYGLMMYNRYDR